MKPLITRQNILAIFFILCLVFQGWKAIQSKSPTADEFSHHVASGYSYWVTGNFKMNPASPPLPRMLSAFPLLFLDIKAPLESTAWEKGDSPEFAQLFFYENGVSAQRIIVWARVPILAVSVLFALCLYFWTVRLFGGTAALAALALYCFNPDILAHSSLATADLCAAFFYFLCTVSFARYLSESTWPNAVLTGVFAGLCFLSKFSAILIFPTLFLIQLFSGRLKKTKFSHMVIFFASLLGVVWAGYGFEMKPLLRDTPDPLKKAAVYEKVGGSALLKFANQTPVPLSTFSSAFISMMYTRSQGTRAFLMGEWSTRGWWYYYFIAFCLKNTIPFLILIILGGITARFFITDAISRALVLIPIVLLFTITLGDRAQAGIRYFLPIYPFFIILASGAFKRLWEMRGALRWIGMALLVWHAGEALRVSPSYLSYFNEIAGGPKNGYRFLRDSNLDWGQDLPALSEIIKKNNYGQIVLHYHWPAKPESYGIDYRVPEEDERRNPRKAVYAISVHSLEQYPWTVLAEPVKTAGYSIFIYDMR